MKLSSMIGKKVYWTSPNSGHECSGKLEAVNGTLVRIDSGWRDSKLMVNFRTTPKIHQQVIP